MSPTGARTRADQIFNVGLMLTSSLMIALVSYVILTRLGLMIYLIALAVLVAVIILFKLSTRDLSFALILWFFTMSGFQSVGRVSMPGLPDVSIDRLLLTWIVFLFLFQLLSGRNRIKGPFTIDILITIHTVYIFGSMFLNNLAYLPHWVNSSMVPLFAYLYGRHIVKEEKQIRNIFYFLLALSVYYFITAIAEYYRIDALVWPKAILDPHAGHLWQPGRSRGPIMHPPLFGQLQAMLAPVYFIFMSRRVGVFKMGLLGISFCLSLVGLFFAYTRGPWLAVAVSLPLLGFMRPKFRRVLGALAIVGVVIGLLGLYQMANSDFLQERLEDSGTFENRLAFFVTSFHIISDSPLFGMGYFQAKNYVWLYNQGGYIPLYGYVSKRSGRDVVPHDIYVGRTADEGLVSIVLLSAIGILALRAFLRQWRADPQGPWFNRDILAVIAAIWVCYLVGGLVIDYRYFDLINVIVYFFMGLIYGFEGQYRKGAPRPAGASA